MSCLGVAAWTKDCSVPLMQRTHGKRGSKTVSAGALNGKGVCRNGGFKVNVPGDKLLSWKVQLLSIRFTYFRKQCSYSCAISAESPERRSKLDKIHYPGSRGRHHFTYRCQVIKVRKELYSGEIEANWQGTASAELPDGFMRFSNCEWKNAQWECLLPWYL